MKLLKLSLCLIPMTLWANNLNRLDLGTKTVTHKSQQGEIKEFKFTGKNLSKDMITIEQVIAQGIGPQNIVHPKQVLPGASFDWSFKYNSSYLKGKTKENLTFIIGDEELYSVEIKGEVTMPVLLYPMQIDVGYLEGNDLTKEIFALSSNPTNEKISLRKKYPGVEISFTPTKISQKEDQLVEDPNGQPGFKITLKLDGKELIKSVDQKKRKSLSQLVEFQSSNFPKATPEIQLIGYKKEK